MKGLVSFIVGVFILFLSINLRGQDFEDFMEKYTDVNGQSYMQPLADAFGANLNSGLYHNAYIQNNGFQLYLGIAVMNAVIPSRSKTFMGTTQGFFRPETRVKAPTIFGKSEVVAIQGEGQTYYTFPGGLDISNLPLAVPHLTVGALYGTDLTLRWMAYDLGKEVGRIQLFGWGLRHSLDQYLPLQPVHVAAGFYNQQFSVGDAVDASAWVANIQASYQWRFITFYGGLGYERSTLDIAYTYEGDDSKIAFDLTGDNTIRGTLGLTLNLGPMKLHSDYTLARQSLLTLGLGVGIGEIQKMGE